jgi:hypothetical protein
MYILFLNRTKKSFYQEKRRKNISKSKAFSSTVSIIQLDNTCLQTNFIMNLLRWKGYY